MKRFFIYATFLLFLACSSDTSVQWFKGTFSEALSQAEMQNKPVLVDFYSPT